MEKQLYTIRIAVAFWLAFTFSSATYGLQLSSISLETFDGKKIACQLDSIGVDGELAGEGVPAGLNVQDLLRVENLSPTTTPTRNVKIMLANDGFVWASEFTSDGQNASIISKTVVGEFPLETMKAVIWRQHRKVETALKNRSPEFDQIVVESGDDQVIVNGLLERVTEEKVEVNYNGKSRKISRSIVLAIVTADLQPKPPTKTIGTFEMVDGSSVTGGIDSFKDGVISVMLDNRNSIRLDASLLRNVFIKSDRIAFLSSMTPIEVDSRAYFGIEREWQRNKSVEGNPLTLNSKTSENPIVYERGIGTQSYSRLVFAVPDDFDRFSATVGIDAETDGKGDCNIIVQADGISVWQGRVKSDDEPQLIDVDISNSKQISLIVQPGKQFDLSDHLDWCNAKFLNTK